MVVSVQLLIEYDLGILNIFYIFSYACSD